MAAGWLGLGVCGGGGRFGWGSAVVDAEPGSVRDSGSLKITGKSNRGRSI